MRKNNNWIKKVGKVFNPGPRNGNDQSVLWVRRITLERKIQDALEFPALHVCIDGPTGTGKSSLALTALSKMKIKVIDVQVTSNMNWNQFCSKVVRIENVRKEKNDTSQIEMGFDKMLPVFKMSKSFGDKEIIVGEDELEKVLSKIDEEIIAKYLHKENLVLKIDDFERANENLTVRISDLAKVMINLSSKGNGKLLIIGANEVYSNLLSANISLENRIEHISVGTLSDRKESWKFLSEGFNSLGIGHPVKFHNRGDKKYTFEVLVELSKNCYDAANGLPKSLNELGKSIAMEAQDRNRVNDTDIRNVSKQMVIKSFKKFRREYPQIFNLVNNNSLIPEVLKGLYKKGIGQIHYIEDIESVSGLPYNQIELAVAELERANFLVRTGSFKETIFVKSPNLAHNLSVIANDPDKYGIPKSVVNNTKQLMLPINRN